MILERAFLTSIAIYLICASYLKKNFLSFNALFNKNKATLKILSKRQAFIVVKIIQKLSKIINLDSCLIKTLAYRNALKLGGCSSIVNIGVMEDDDEIFSHCWIESDGLMTDKPINHSKFKIIKKIE